MASAAPNRVLRHQARALKREAEIICGELLIWMQASGLRRGNEGDVRTEVGRARPSIASLTGFSHRALTSRWQRTPLLPARDDRETCGNQFAKVQGSDLATVKDIGLTDAGDDDSRRNRAK